MALTEGAFPYDLTKLLGGRVRVLISDLSVETPVAVPDSINDIIELDSPYKPKTKWVDLGAARDSASYSRSFETEGWDIQQVNSAVFEEVTGTSRSVTVSIAEIREDLLEIIEESPGAETVAEAKEISAQKAIPGATAAGNAPTEKTAGGDVAGFGGASAGGAPASARVASVSQGATANGFASGAGASTEIGGGVASGTDPTGARVASASGGGDTGGNGPSTRVPVQLGGAIAGGEPPTGASEVAGEAHVGTASGEVTDGQPASGSTVAAGGTADVVDGQPATGSVLPTATATIDVDD